MSGGTVQVAPSVDVVTVDAAGGGRVELVIGQASVDIAPSTASVSVEAVASADVEISAPAPVVIEMSGAITTLGASDSGHDARDTLVHRLAESADAEFEYSGGNLVRQTVWTSPLRAVKVRETLLTYSADDLVETVTTQHDGSGSVVSTLARLFTYSAGELTGVTSTLT